MFGKEISPDKDPMGAAIADYFANGKAGKLKVLSSMFEEDEIVVRHLFRSYPEMPQLEQIALRQAEGKILDVGAGTGCHALALQEMGKTVHAIDISALSVDVMRRRGVKSVEQQDFFSPTFAGQFDTILMLMNGSGIVGKVEHLPQFFKKLKLLLSPQGCVLMDSSDLCYLFEDDDLSYEINLNDAYYGEVDFRMKYKNIQGERFDWLYIDFQTLSYYAEESGFVAELIAEGEHYDYLAKLRRR